LPPLSRRQAASALSGLLTDITFTPRSRHRALRHYYCAGRAGNFNSEALSGYAGRVNASATLLAERYADDTDRFDALDAIISIT
jgi:hypothetical protein